MTALCVSLCAGWHHIRQTVRSRACTMLQDHDLLGYLTLLCLSLFILGRLESRGSTSSLDSSLNDSRTTRSPSVASTLSTPLQHVCTSIHITFVTVLQGNPAREAKLSAIEHAWGFSVRTRAILASPHAPPEPCHGRADAQARQTNEPALQTTSRLASSNACGPGGFRP